MVTLSYNLNLFNYIINVSHTGTGQSSSLSQFLIGGLLTVALRTTCINIKNIQISAAHWVHFITFSRIATGRLMYAVVARCLKVRIRVFTGEQTYAFTM